MPWNITEVSEARRAFVAWCWREEATVAEACRRFGISRQCGHKWLRRAQAEGWSTLVDRSHRTCADQGLWQRWWPRVQRLKSRYRFAGADQLRWHLQRSFPLGPWPCARTIGRWLQRAGLTQRRRRPARPGPMVELKRRLAEVANDVWTVDFKGWFYTGDGQRICALTVRDDATNFVFLVRHMRRTAEPHVRQAFARLFNRYGVPRAIRTDNGPPFGGEGPYGWSTLSVWFVRLGIEVEHGRPACPQDNAKHEQMHGVLKQQTATPPAQTAAGQQRRFDRWRVTYNRRRPHSSIGMHPPISLYQPSARKPVAAKWTYPQNWEIKKTDPRGRIRWRNKARLIGQAFGCQTIALNPLGPDVVAVHFGPHLLGELHASDHTGIRLVRPSCPRRSGRGG